MEPRQPLPPFTEETAKQKIQMAEDAWNSKDPERVAKTYTPNSEWPRRMKERKTKHASRRDARSVA